MVDVLVERLAHGADLPLPRYETPGAAGADLHAALSEDLIVEPGATALVPTALKIALPEGYEGQVRPRSGLAAKHGITVLNSPGTIDSDYRGEVKVLLINHGRAAFTVCHGMRIAQMVVAPVVQATFVATDALHATQRGEGGFGSTGTESTKPQ